jgi:hypothetical protein
MRAKLGWSIVAALGLMAAIVAIREEMNRRALQQQLAETGQARIDGGQTTLSRPSTLVPTEDLERSRNEAARLRRQVNEARSAEREDEKQRRFAIGITMPSSDWKNAGAFSVRAALETALWCGASGDFETLGRTIFFENGKTRAEAEALLLRLRAEIPSEIVTPELLIAFLTVKDVPRGSVEVRKYTPIEGWPGPTQLVELFMTGEDASTRDTRLLFTQHNEQWKLVVMASVVEKYAAQFPGRPATAVIQPPAP